MAKERLSKLQKWILEKCLKELFVTRNRAKEFFGHEDTKRHKFSLTNSERVILFRSFANLLRKNLLYQHEGWRVYCLTETGFLKVNSFHASATYISFKDYYDAVEEMNEERKKYWEVLKSALAVFRGNRVRRK